MALTLEVDNLRMMRWCVDVSFAVHDDMHGHTGGEMTAGKGGIHSEIIKQKIVGESRVETETIVVDDTLPQVSWSDHFVKAQGWTYSTGCIRTTRMQHHWKMTEGSVVAAEQSTSMFVAISLKM